MLQKYIAYIKDNPKDYWFKRKLYGWGWVPAKPQGWLVVLLYVFLVVILAMRLENVVGRADALRSFFVPLIITTAIFLWVTYMKGESPKWQWGKRVED